MIFNQWCFKAILLTGLLILQGCNRPLRLKGRLKVVDPNYEVLALLGFTGFKYTFESGEYHINFLDKNTVYFQKVGEEKPIRLKFTGDLTPLTKSSRLLLSAEETGQKYDIEIQKRQKFLSRDEKRKYINCWYKDHVVEYDEGYPVHKSKLIEGHEKALVERNKNHVYFTLTFLHPGAEKKILAVYAAAPTIEYEEKTLQHDPQGCR